MCASVALGASRVSTAEPPLRPPPPAPLPHIDVRDAGRDHEESELDDSMSDIREALDQAFATLPTPPTSSPTHSVSGHGAHLDCPHTPVTDSKRLLLTTTNLAESASSSLQAKKRNSSAAASIISTASSGVRHTHRGPAPTRPPQCPLPPPPSSPLSATSTTAPHRPALSLNRNEKPAHSFDSGVEMQSKSQTPGKLQSRSPSPPSPVTGRRQLLTPEPNIRVQSLSHSSKRPSTSSVITDMTATTSSGSVDASSGGASKRVWRISSTGQHYLDDDFTAAFGTPSRSQATDDLFNEDAKRQYGEQEDSAKRAAYLSPSVTASPHSGRSSSTAQFPAFQHRGPLLLSESTTKAGIESSSSDSQQLSPSLDSASSSARRPSVQGLPYVSKPLVPQPYGTTATSTAAAAAAALREQKMALLRARQLELLREQEQLEALEREAQEAAKAETAAAQAAAQARANAAAAASEDTDMHDRSDDHDESVRSTAAALPSSRSKRNERAALDASSSAAALNDLATEFEVASLRAQVTQLQLALKRQMSTSVAGGEARRARSSNGSSGNNHPSQFRMGAPMAEFMGVPTPEESFAGSSAGLSNDGGGTFARLPRSTSASQRPSAGDEYAWPHRSAAGSVRYPSHNGGSVVSSRAYTQHGDSASQLMQPGDDRVDELSQKLDRLEELFRLTALQQPQQPSAGHSGVQPRHHDSDSSSTVGPPPPHHHHAAQQHTTHVPAGILPDNHGGHPYQQHAGQHDSVRTASQSSAASSYAHSYSSLNTRSPTVMSAFNYNATTPSGARYSPELQTMANQHGYAHQQQSPLRPHHGDGGQGTLRLSVPTQGNYDVSPTSSVSSDLSAHGQRAPGTGSSAGRATTVEHVRRKGVARFILGSSTTRLVDAHGGAVVPSMPISMSRSRAADRVEKLPPKVKVKQAAGRGRVTVVQKKPT